MSKLIESFKINHINKTQKNNLLGACSDQVYKNVSIVRTAQEVNKSIKLNELEKKYDKSMIYKSVIQPLTEEKDSSHVLSAKHDAAVKNHVSDLSDYRKTRTNLPYKAVLVNILKEEDYKKKISDEKDLVVHVTTNADKKADIVKVEKEFKEFNNLLEKHTNELKMLYSLSEKNEHMQKFEYNRISKVRVKYDPQEYNEMKQDKIDFLKKEQEKLDANSKTLDDIIDTMLRNGMCTDQEKQILKDVSDTNDIDETTRSKYKNRQKKS